MALSGGTNWAAILQLWRIIARNVNLIFQDSNLERRLRGWAAEQSPFLTSRLSTCWNDLIRERTCMANLDQPKQLADHCATLQIKFWFLASQQIGPRTSVVLILAKVQVSRVDWCQTTSLTFPISFYKKMEPCSTGIQASGSYNWIVILWPRSSQISMTENDRKLAGIIQIGPRLRDIKKISSLVSDISTAHGPCLVFWNSFFIHRGREEAEVISPPLSKCLWES